MKILSIVTVLGITTASQSFANIWAEEPDSPEPENPPGLKLVKDTDKNRSLQLNGLRIDIPEELYSEIELLAKDQKRVSIGTNMFAVSLLASEVLVPQEISDNGELLGKKFGVDYFALAFTCDSDLQFNHLKSLADQPNENLNFELDQYRNKQLEDLLVFKMVDQSDGYTVTMGAINRSLSECYSVSINTYGVQQQGLSIENVSTAISFIVNPSYSSLWRL